MGYIDCKQGKERALSRQQPGGFCWVGVRDPRLCTNSLTALCQSKRVIDMLVNTGWKMTLIFTLSLTQQDSWFNYSLPGWIKAIKHCLKTKPTISSWVYVEQFPHVCLLLSLCSNFMYWYQQIWLQLLRGCLPPFYIKCYKCVFFVKRT